MSDQFTLVRSEPFDRFSGGVPGRGRVLGPLLRTDPGCPRRGPAHLPGLVHRRAERGHRTLHIIGKGGKPALIPLPPPVARALDLAADQRSTGPLLLTRTGARMDRYAASRIVHRLAKKAGIEHRVGCHSLRHSSITAALDAGVTLRDVQIAARHADPRTTTRYDRARGNLDRHANSIVAAFIAGAAWQHENRHSVRSCPGASRGACAPCRNGT